MSFSQIYLRGKRDKEQEYTLHLFEKCNLSCSFCWQDHKAYEGVDTVRDKLIPVKEYLMEEIAPAVVFNVMGGEVFDDSIFNDSLYYDYIHLAYGIHQDAERLGKTSTINFVSNLVTNQPEKVEDLILTLRAMGVNAQLTTSYDSKGRFNQSQFTNFKENVEWLREYITGVSMLFTKPVIKQIINGEDDYFKYLYDNNFEIYFDYYTPTTGWAGAPNGEVPADNESHLVIGPSDKDLVNAFYFLIDNYPNVQPIKGWIENHENPLSCRSTKLVLSDGTKCMCGKLHLENTKLIAFYKSTIKADNNDEIEENFLTKHNCLSCEYFQRCQMGCFMQHDFMKRGHLSDCLFKITFDKITKGIVVDLETIPQHFGQK